MAPSLNRGIYVASRASVPARPAFWRELRSQGWGITSSWIDASEEPCFGTLWERIEQEIQASVGVVLYAQAEDFPLRGALIECGLALGMGKPVALVLPGVEVEVISFRPIGSWVCHPRVKRFETVEEARAWLLTPAA